MTSRLVSSLVFSVALAVVSAAFAAEPAGAPSPTGAQVQELQKQLEQLSKELADMRQLVESSQLSAQQRQMMMGHMGNMQTQMRGMMSSCCTMDPASCPTHMR